MLLKRCRRLSELEQRVRGGCREARRQPEVLAEVGQLRELLAEPGAGDDAGPLSGWAEHEAAAYGQKVRRDAAGFCRDVLENYHAFVEADGEAGAVWASLLRLLLQCEGGTAGAGAEPEDSGSTVAAPPVVGGSAAGLAVPAVEDGQASSAHEGRELTAVATQCICAGVRKLYAAQTEGYDKSIGELGEIATAATEQLAHEADYSAPFFGALLPGGSQPQVLRSIAAVLATVVREDYGACAISELLEGESESADGQTVEEDGPTLRLGPEVARCISSLSALDEELVAAGLPPEETLLGYRCQDGAKDGAEKDQEERRSNRFLLLVESWVEEQRDEFEGFLERCVAMEEECGWSPMLEDIHESASVRDLFTLFSQTVDFFLEMDLPWEDSFLSLLEHIVGAAIKYANILYTSCAGLFPAPPPHPRLKRPSRGNDAGRGAAVLVAGARRLAGGGGGGGGSGDDTELNSVIVRLNNVQYASQEFEILWSRLTEKWSEVDGVQSAGSGAALSAHGKRRLDAMLGGMENSYRTTAADLTAALGAMLTYGTGAPYTIRGALLDSLYLGSATASARLDDSLCAAIEEAMLERLAPVASPSLLPQLLRELRGAVLRCYERVLLHGGASRVFALEDAAILKEDYVALLATFASLKQELMDAEDFRVGSSSRRKAREQLLLEAVEKGGGGLDACVCSRCASPIAATIFCCDCGSALYCAPCSKEVHTGGWAEHDTWKFGDAREQGRAHGLLQLFSTDSDSLVRQLTEITNAPAAAPAARGFVDASDIASVLAHRDDDTAISYLKQHVDDYLGRGGDFILGSGEDAAPSTPGSVGSGAPSTPGSAGLARQGSAGRISQELADAAGSLVGGLAQRMRD